MRQMKVSFSRKGFDSKNGGQPNAILPDGTLLPFPIPSNDGFPNTYESLYYGEHCFYDIISSLNTHPQIKAHEVCHLDPDLRRDTKPRLNGWLPAFGQAEQSLSELYNNNFGAGDLFLFFGWFKETEIRKGKIIYKRMSPDIHLIYGYLQVGDIIKSGDLIPDWLLTHPHSKRIISGSTKDAIFLPTEFLSFAQNLPGTSMLRYSPELVLTAPGMSRSRWKLPDFFQRDNIKIGHSPRQPKDVSYFQSAPIGQEMIWETTPEAMTWIRNICNCR